MGSRVKGLERALLALFVASGFAGLIYQAIWSHYLGLSLGHAAYAQTLVLAIFMGGMALGAWLVSRFGTGWRRLILAYAIIELVIGVAGLVFHPVFMAYTGFSQGTVYPALGSELTVSAWQWGSAALLIAPQSILLGMTFPLMSGGYLRVAPGADGEILGGLYFSNSIGAAMGALAATFVLLPWVGMPGSVAIAGGLNIAVGLLAWAVSRRADLASATAPPAVVPAAPVASPEPGGAAAAGTEAASFKQMMLVAAAITGASSFVYEIGWVRMLNQALGTTVHSFELMLSAFILGLAFGGLWIRSRSQCIRDAVAYAGYAQLFMGIAALLSILVFSQSFRWVGAMVESLPKTEDGYALYSLGSAGIALLVMFPAAFFAGMTLPLFTMALLRRGAGEASIGQVYAANTLGAILGVVLAVHLLIPLLGLRLAVTLAALADIVLGVVLLRLHADAVGKRPYIAAVAACVLALGLSLVLGKPDPRALASGVFRHGMSELDETTRIHYLRDGKTATIALYSQGSVATIATNGKPDASLELDPAAPPVADEVTMLMAAALPLAIHPQPHDVAIIGWGSGLTTHTVLGSSTPRWVDSIEIERAMYDGARLYADRVERAYHDPRSRLHIDDARTYFSTGKKRYDVIISEPSNPWVSGVSSLFTQQFYRFLGNHLNDDGIAIQWLQSYELSDPLLATMLAALHAEFPHIDVYLTNSADLLFVSSRSPLPALDAGRLAEPALAAELARVGLAGNGDYAVRRIGSRDLVGALVTLSGVGPHSDFHPVVALEAPKARFMGATARQMLTLMSLGVPVLEMTDGRTPVPLDQPVQFAGTSIGSEIHWVAGGIRVAMTGGNTSVLDTLDPLSAESVARLRAATAAGPVDEAAWLQAAAEVADFSLGHLRAPDLEGLWINPTWIDPAAQPEAIRHVLAAYAAAGQRDAAAMLRDGRLALEAMGEDAPGLAREQMLVIMMLGALDEGGAARLAEIEREFGARVPAASNYGLARAYLLAWGDTARR